MDVTALSLWITPLALVLLTLRGWLWRVARIPRLGYLRLGCSTCQFASHLAVAVVGFPVCVVARCYRLHALFLYVCMVWLRLVAAFCPLLGCTHGCIAFTRLRRYPCPLRGLPLAVAHAHALRSCGWLHTHTFGWTRAAVALAPHWFAFTRLRLPVTPRYFVIAPRGYATRTLRAPLRFNTHCLYTVAPVTRCRWFPGCVARFSCTYWCRAVLAAWLVCGPCGYASVTLPLAVLTFITLRRSYVGCYYPTRYPAAVTVYRVPVTPPSLRLLPWFLLPCRARVAPRVDFPLLVTAPLVAPLPRSVGCAHVYRVWLLALPRTLLPPLGRLRLRVAVVTCCGYARTVYAAHCGCCLVTLAVGCCPVLRCLVGLVALHLLVVTFILRFAVSVAGSWLLRFALTHVVALPVWFFTHGLVTRYTVDLPRCLRGLPRARLVALAPLRTHTLLYALVLVIRLPFVRCPVTVAFTHSCNTLRFLQAGSRAFTRGSRLVGTHAPVLVVAVTLPHTFGLRLGYAPFALVPLPVALVAVHALRFYALRTLGCTFGYAHPLVGFPRWFGCVAVTRGFGYVATFC